jgi:hypothetical protein
MKNNPEKGTSQGTVERFVAFMIIALIVILGFLVFFLVRDYRSLRREQVISAREFLLGAVVKNHGHQTASEVTVIRSWMTFDYINQLFGVPAYYLKGQMSITDSRYPKLSLSSYAKESGVASAKVVSVVSGFLTTYLTNATSSLASSTLK